MGIKIADLKRDRRTLTIDVPIDEDTTEEFTFTYRPSAYTPDFEKADNETRKGEWKSLSGVNWVLGMLTDWDLVYTDDDGDDHVLPLDQDSVAALPLDFITLIIKSIGEDVGKRQAS